MNLTGVETFPMALIIRARSRFNQKQFTWHKAIHTINCNKQLLEHTVSPDIEWEMWQGFIFKVNFLSRLLKPIELSKEWFK